jgi:hypothetical protein
LIAIICVSAISSCKKKDGENSSHFQHQVFLSKVKAISSKHKKPKSAARLSEWQWYVIKEDLNGAAIGAGLGGGIGGAAFVGGLFSYMAFMPVYSAYECGNVVCSGSTCNNETFSNSANPYDFVGYAHNVIALDALAHRNAISEVDSDPNNLSGCKMNPIHATETCLAKAGELFEVDPYTDMYDTMGLSETFILAELDSFITNYHPDSTDYQEERFDYLERRGQISSDTRAVLEVYYETLETLTLYTDVYDYTEELEEELENSELSLADKAILFSVFSTCRYSAGMWLTIMHFFG